MQSCPQTGFLRHQARILLLYLWFSDYEALSPFAKMCSIVGGGGDGRIKIRGSGAELQDIKLATLAKKAHENHKKLQKSVNRLQESLDYLRICIKYQLFDLEATRRENKYLRKMLEEKDSK
jgi:hypothetical protein